MKNLTPTFKKHLTAINGHRIIIATIILLIVNFFFFSAVYSQSNTYTYTSSGTFYAPAGVDSVVAQVWGGGGKGGNAHGLFDFGCGGGGGSFAGSWVIVDPSIEYSAFVGLGGSGSHPDGGDSGFGPGTFWSVSVMAKGGEQGTFSSPGSFGNQAFGQITHYGGNGAYPLITPVVWQSGGGGGGAGTVESGGMGGNLGLGFGKMAGSGGDWWGGRWWSRDLLSRKWS